LCRPHDGTVNRPNQSADCHANYDTYQITYTLSNINSKSKPNSWSNCTDYGSDDTANHDPYFGSFRRTSNFPNRPSHDDPHCSTYSLSNS
jgi:hypothetical protein